MLTFLRAMEVDLAFPPGPGNRLILLSFLSLVFLPSFGYPWVREWSSSVFRRAFVFLAILGIYFCPLREKH